MPNETPAASTLELTPATPNAAQHNAAVAVTVAEQGRDAMKPATQEITSLETNESLENLRSTVLKEKAEKAEDDEIQVEPKVEAPAAPEVKVETPAAPEVKVETPAPVGDDIFKDIALPANVKPKSAEAFAAVKTRAAQEITARDTEIANLKKAVADLEEKSNSPVPDEILKEVEDLRNFRAKLDVEADPKFKEYDKAISDNHAFVYSQLLKTGKITQENIEQIKKYGGPAKVNLQKVFEAIGDPTVQRIVESKLADEEMLHFQKEQAIKEKKENISQYLKEREEGFKKASSAHTEATKQHYTALTGKLDWLKEKTVTKDMDDAAKADVKSHNEFVATLKKDLDATLVDDSPEMRAILITGMAQLFHVQRANAASAKKVEALEKQLAEATSKIERYKNASKSRLPDSAAPVGGKPVEVKKDDYTLTTGDALENIRKKIQQERAEKAAA